eukprot:TRINITY_DN12445_c0_g1_i1.p1 TRINITY_DN12445_c0_g1~~TRINITY_DN12445_c0_g1_i1.p1  ORF type:complete len:185 (-),score=52.87 TRINITY_DN12445_c0_g1_i1:5-508(-)
MGLKSIKKRHNARTQPKGSIRKAKKKKKNVMGKMSVAFAGIRDRWDEGTTVKENYRQLGLKMNPNERAPKVKAEDPIEFNVPAPAPSREARLSHQEIACVRALIAKHGNNYRAMQRDIKINIYQNTKKQLQKKCELYLSKYASQEADSSHETTTTTTTTSTTTNSNT